MPGAQEAAQHFREKLAFTTDPADVWSNLGSGAPIVVIDARAPEAFAQAHIPGAVNLPHRTMDAKTTAGLPRDRVLVVYCDGIGCNASTKGALRLSELGFIAREMLGGLDWWRRDGLPIETGSAAVAAACGC